MIVSREEAMYAQPASQQKILLNSNSVATTLKTLLGFHQYCRDAVMAGPGVGQESQNI